MRPSKTVAGAALTAALALAALPGLAGSRSLSPAQGVDAASYQSISVGAWPSRSPGITGPLDPAQRSDGFVDGSVPFEEPGQAHTTPAKAAVKQPVSKSTYAWKTPLYTLTGDGTYYSAGTTAMRLPRGTVVVICAAGGCIERVVSDYGPDDPVRIVDLYKPDFFAICMCASSAGVIPVTVKVY